MFNKNHNRNGETQAFNYLAAIATGLFVGAAAGAVVMLFVAPQSGRKTRALVRHKALELRDRADDLADEVRDRADETLHQARSKTKQLTKEARATAKDLQKRGVDLVEKQKEQVESALGNGRQALAGLRR
jgi:gas vesicle protein